MYFQVPLESISGVFLEKGFQRLGPTQWWIYSWKLKRKWNHCFKSISQVTHSWNHHELCIHSTPFKTFVFTSVHKCCIVHIEPPRKGGGGQNDKKWFVYHGPTPSKFTSGLDKLCRKKIIVKKVGRPYFGGFSRTSLEKKKHCSCRRIFYTSQNSLHPPQIPAANHISHAVGWAPKWAGFYNRTAHGVKYTVFRNMLSANFAYTLHTLTQF